MNQTGAFNRWTKYEVRDGRLCGAPGADLEPFDAYAQGREVFGGVRVPYLDLINIAERRDVEALKAWCARWGLLGIGIHRHLSVGFRKMLVEHVGEGADFKARYTMMLDPPPEVDPVNPTETLRFWRAYSEPIEDVFFVALQFRDRLLDMQAFIQKPTPENLLGARRFSQFFAREAFTSYVQPQVVRKGRATRGTIERGWAVKSNLAFLADLAVTPLTTIGVLADLAEGEPNPVARCGAEGCTSWFLPTRSWSEFCSTRCQERQKKREQRAAASKKPKARKTKTKTK
ncbi:MAG TPA: hypothetical protein VN033_12355 [Vulgatibacter sp.]|nr:hypothetical protein [Vulgatibacter sp.]